MAFLPPPVSLSLSLFHPLHCWSFYIICNAYNVYMLVLCTKMRLHEGHRLCKLLYRPCSPVENIMLCLGLKMISLLPKAQKVLIFMSKVGSFFKHCQALTRYQYILNSIISFLHAGIPRPCRIIYTGKCPNGLRGSHSN